MAPDPEVLSSLQAAVVVDGDRCTLRRGQEIPEGLSESDRERLERRGSIVRLSEFRDVTAQREAFKDAGEAQKYGESAPKTSGNELVDWLQSEEPNVSDTVAKAGEDPQLAADLLDAENAATGGDPRKGVVEGLTSIIEKAND